MMVGAMMVEAALPLGFLDLGSGGSAACYARRPALVGLPEWPSSDVGLS